MNIIHVYGLMRFIIQTGLNQALRTDYKKPLLGYIIERDLLQPETDRHENIGAAQLDLD